MELIGIVRRMVDLAKEAMTVEVKEEVKEDWDAEADRPPFYLPRERTGSYISWSVRCPACGGRPSRCPCT